MVFSPARLVFLQHILLNSAQASPKTNADVVAAKEAALNQLDTGFTVPQMAAFINRQIEE